MNIFITIKRVLANIKKYDKLNSLLNQNNEKNQNIQ